MKDTSQMKARLYLNTIKYLKPRQIYYQLWYQIKRRIFKYHNSYSSSITYHPSPKKEFTFINITHNFTDSIDWNYMGNGKLWCYNLNYFDFIHDMDVSEAENIILDYISKLNYKSIGIEPYCISLRGINWIKWLVANPQLHNSTTPQLINSSLRSQYQHLTCFLEYHIQGNHLLENAISLLWAGVYFQNDFWINKSCKLLTKELKEQILPNGAHFELSPMYHQIILHRLLETYSFLEDVIARHKVAKQATIVKVQQLLKTTISNMLSYLNSITFSNGDIPMVNDSTNGIAPTTAELNKLAEKLDILPLIRNNAPSQFGAGTEGLINSSTFQLFNSPTYQLITMPNYELFVDVSEIGASYIPGHAHADTFNFILYVKSPLIVDTAISTYENNKTRQFERSTKAHNTVEVNGKDSSQTWSAFRVGNRAKILDLEVRAGYISAKHDGYRDLGCIHERSFDYQEKEIVITDLLHSNKDVSGIAYFHLSDDVKVSMKNNTVIVNGVIIEFIGQDSIELQKYSLAKGFNVLVDSTKIAVRFNRKLVTKVLI